MNFQPAGWGSGFMSEDAKNEIKELRGLRGMARIDSPYECEDGDVFLELAER